MSHQYLDISKNISPDYHEDPTLRATGSKGCSGTDRTVARVKETKGHVLQFSVGPERRRGLSVGRGVPFTQRVECRKGREGQCPYPFPECFLILKWNILVQSNVANT